MNILLLGSGGRECAFAWKIRQSKKLSRLWIAPGNAGTSLYGTNVNIAINNFSEVKKFALENKIDMIVVGPEDLLVNGIKNIFSTDNQTKHIGIIGTSAEGAMLEGSKDFAKKFMQRNQIPTAQFNTFDETNIQHAYLFLEKINPPYVLKADGLAAGKGVIITENLDEAKQVLSDMLVHSKFGKASTKVVIEEYLNGIELSVFIITDGIDYHILPEAKDYKRIGDNDTGPNTGGMGAVSPVPFADDTFMKKVEQRIIVPTINGLKKENINYTGFLFFGLMNVNGNPYLIEYNVRMGDPEGEVVIPRIKSDIIDLFEGVVNKNISEKKLFINKKHTACVMLVSSGYPGNFEKGKIISGLETIHDSLLFHAGTLISDENKNMIITNGGRVIAVTSYGENMKTSLALSYLNVAKIEFDGKYYRKDIGKDI